MNCVWSPLCGCLLSLVSCFRSRTDLTAHWPTSCPVLLPLSWSISPGEQNLVTVLSTNYYLEVGYWEPLICTLSQVFYMIWIKRSFFYPIADFSTRRWKRSAMIFPAAIVAPKFGEELSFKEKLYLSFSISGALCSRQRLERVKIMWFTITPGLGQLSQVFEDVYYLKTFTQIFLIPLRSTSQT